jgi:acyl phosphate:glycerol-3-phosphate acyltransferase
MAQQARGIDRGRCLCDKLGQAYCRESAVLIQILAVSFVLISFLPLVHTIFVARLKSALVGLSLQGAWLWFLTQEITPPMGLALGGRWSWAGMLAAGAGIAYLLGSIPSGVVLGKVLGWGDPRQTGSGNIGATNVARLAGWRAGALVFAADFAKGAIAVWLCKQIFPPEMMATSSAFWTFSAMGLCVISGHIWPRFLGFRGGKGVATAGGACAVLMPWAVIGGLFVWAGTRWATGYASLASLLACAALAPLAWSLYDGAHGAFAAGIFLLMAYTHRSNIVRLWSQSELSAPTFTS